MKWVIVLGGASPWRSMISAIWYERHQGDGTYLYSTPDGYLFGRYLRNFGEQGEGSWVGKVLNEFIDGDGQFLFLDLGIQGEQDWRDWLLETPYRQRVWVEERWHLVWFYWGNRGDFGRLRHWYKGWLGWFNERKFMSQPYFPLLQGLYRDWVLRNSGWREFVRRVGNIQRLRLKIAEEQIGQGLDRILKELSV